MRNINMESQINPHDDISLSEKIYPSGDKSEAQAMCICGAVKINIKTQSPEMSTFCHCWSCRRAHSAPMYHVIYCCTANIDCRTGKKKSGNFEITVVKGFDHLQQVKGGPGIPNYQTFDDSPRVGGIGRLFCRDCGTIMLNAFYRKIEDKGERYGVFPGTFTDKMNIFLRAWQPTSHINCESAIINVSAIQDGLKKYQTMTDSELFIK